MNQDQKLLGEIWTILYIETDLHEDGLPHICEKILIKLKELGWNHE